jgi:hypothetical protein
MDLLAHYGPDDLDNRRGRSASRATPAPHQRSGVVAEPAEGYNDTGLGVQYSWPCYVLGIPADLERAEATIPNTRWPHYEPSSAANAL